MFDQAEFHPIEVIQFMDPNIGDDETGFFSKQPKKAFPLTFSAEAIEPLLRGMRLGMVASQPGTLRKVLDTQFQGHFKVPADLKMFPDNLTITE